MSKSLYRRTNKVYFFRKYCGVLSLYDRIFQLILGFVEDMSRLSAAIQAKNMGANAIVGYRVVSFDSDQTCLHYGTAVYYTRKCRNRQS